MRVNVWDHMRWSCWSLLDGSVVAGFEWFDRVWNFNFEVDSMVLLWVRPRFVSSGLLWIRTHSFLFRFAFLLFFLCFSVFYLCISSRVASNLRSVFMWWTSSKPMHCRCGNVWMQMRENENKIKNTIYLDVWLIINPSLFLGRPTERIETKIWSPNHNGSWVRLWIRMRTSQK